MKLSYDVLRPAKENFDAQFGFLGTLGVDVYHTRSNDTSFKIK